MGHNLTWGLYMSMLRVSHDILTVDASGWTSVPRFKERWQARTGVDFVPEAFGYHSIDEYFRHLEYAGLIFMLPTASGPYMLCPRTSLCEMLEPQRDIAAAVNRYLAGPNL